jgi:hypothetical protein
MRAEVVSTVASCVAVTMMLSDTPAGLSSKFTVIDSPASRTTPLFPAVANLCAVAWMIKVEACRPGTTNEPCSLATVVRIMLVRSLATVIDAPGMTAPLLSLTVPVIWEDPACAAAIAAVNNSQVNIRPARPGFLSSENIVFSMCGLVLKRPSILLRGERLMGAGSAVVKE